MSTLRSTETTPGTKMPVGEKIAAWLIVAMIAYLFIAG
jgi:hypothetical protein